MTSPTSPAASRTDGETKRKFAVPELPEGDRVNRTSGTDSSARPRMNSKEVFAKIGTPPLGRLRRVRCLVDIETGVIPI